MKKSLLLLSVVAAAFSCAEVEQVTPTINNEAKQITIGVAMPDEAPATRVAVSEDITSGDWVTNWEAGDAIAVSSQSKYAVSKFDIDEGFTSKYATFSGELQDAAKPIRMIYPYENLKMRNNTYGIDLTNQDVVLNSLSSLSKHSHMINESMIDPTVGLDDQKMVHLTTAMQLNLRFANIEDGATAILSRIVVGADSSIEIPTQANVNMTKDASSAEIFNSTTNSTITLTLNKCEIANYANPEATEYSIYFNALPFELAQDKTLAIAVYVEYIKENTPSIIKKVLLEATNSSADVISFAAGTHSTINKIVDMDTATASDNDKYLSTVFTEDFESGSNAHFATGSTEVFADGDNNVLKFINTQGENQFKTQIGFNLTDVEKNYEMGSTYELSFKAKADNAMSIPSGALHANGIGDHVANIDNTQFEITTEWSTVTIRFIVNTTQGRTIVFNTGLCPSGSVYIDDIAVRKVNTNYVDPADKPYYWKVITSGGDFNDDEASKWVFANCAAKGVIVDMDGNKVFKLSNAEKQYNVDADGNKSENVWGAQFHIEYPYTYAGDKCKISFKIKSENGSTIPGLVEQYDANGGLKDVYSEQYSADAAKNIETTTEWQTKEYEYTVAKDYAYKVKSAIGMIVDTFYFDDVKVCIWTNEE